ncbi:MAG: alpha/beta hydrolase [Phycisphaerae bacterium]|jgi:pimeloyl-ACP methyl ester carboxylesterase|nr:alpha/beta hydrolase [Phycisphaerae bacterium]
MTRLFSFALILFAVLSGVSGCNRPDDPPAPPPQPTNPKPDVISSDGVAISYDISGSGEPTLVFVHGWCCDRTYWRHQIPRFAKRYRVVAIDLGGHGDSGLNRSGWTIESFGRDVAAVVKALDLKRVILIGHSMGGPVNISAAGDLPGRVTGLIGVDCYNDIDAEYNAYDTNGFVSALRANFTSVTASSVRSMFVADSDEDLVEQVIADMSSTPPAVGAGAMRSFLKFDRIAALKGLGVPIRCINSDRRSTDVPAGKRYAMSFELKFIKGVGHFPMLEAPEEFNKLLADTIEELGK